MFWVRGDGLGSGGWLRELTLGKTTVSSTLPVGLQQGSCTACLHQQSKNKFGSEAKEGFIFWFKDGGLGACTPEHTFSSAGCGWGRFKGFSQWAGEGAEFSWGGLSCATHAPVCCPGATSLRTARCCRHLGLRYWVQPFSTRNSGVKCWVKASAYRPPWASETRLRPKKKVKKKKVRLYFFTRVLFLFCRNW